MSKHRLELFTDAVLAIILTLMVLDLHEPEAGGWYGMAHLLPSVIIYAAVFALICCAWLVHHNMLSHVEHINRKMLWANFGFLFLMSMDPLLLRMVVDHPHDSAIMVVFIANTYLALTCMTFFRLAAKRDHAMEPGFEEWYRKRRRGSLIGTAAMSIQIGAAFLSPMMALALVTVTMLWFLTTV